MADRVIDYDLGVVIKNHPNTGMDVFMYIDEPGKYLTAHGKEVSDQIAGEAGYDVVKLSKEKSRRERVAAATDLINKELADEKDIVENLVIEREGWKVVSFGAGRHNVLDPDGNILNKLPLTKEMAEKLFLAMAPAQPSVEKVIKNK